MRSVGEVTAARGMGWDRGCCRRRIGCYRECWNTHCCLCYRLGACGISCCCVGCHHECWKALLVVMGVGTVAAACVTGLILVVTVHPMTLGCRYRCRGCCCCCRRVGCCQECGEATCIMGRLLVVTIHRCKFRCVGQEALERHSLIQSWAGYSW